MKRVKRVISVLFSLILLFTFIPSNEVFANSIESIDIKAEIQDDGSVIIRDHRIFYADQGTEHYISLGNLGDSEISDFQVYDESMIPLQNIGNWDTSASLEEKAGKYGINWVGDELELCFGIGQLGRREFTLQYKITNFVRNLNDGNQAFYWKFINDDIGNISKAKVVVTNKKGYKFEYPKTRIWGYGYQGRTDISEGELLLESEATIDRSNYMVALGIFEGKVFSTPANFDKSSEDLIALSKEGSYSYNDEEASDDQNQNDDFTPNMIVGNIGNIFFSTTMFGMIMAFIARKFSKNTRSAKLNVLPREKDVDGYYRDVPYEDFALTYYLTETDVSNLMSAYILKWINAGMLKDDVEEVGFIFKKDQLALKLLRTDLPYSADSNERTLWDMVKIASKGDGILSQKEFNNYIYRNTEKFNTWISSVTSTSGLHLRKNGFTNRVEKKSLGIFPYKVDEFTDKSKELVTNIFGFKNYLKDFSLLNERGMSETGLWKEYLIWAAYLGIAEEVFKQFQIVDPSFAENLDFDIHTLYYTNMFANSVRQSIDSANTISTASSGGGGSSFGGGGGGSFGGGSGGGTR